jgi:chlorite dismutase
VEAIQQEQLERLEAQHRQTDLDEDIKRRIEEEAQKVREKHRQIHQAEAQLRMDTAMLGASVDGISSRLATDEVQLQSNQLAIEREVARAQQVEALVQAHQKAQERTQAARDAHMEAQLAQDEELIQRHAADLGGSRGRGGGAGRHQ